MRKSFLCKKRKVSFEKGFQRAVESDSIRKESIHPEIGEKKERLEGVKVEDLPLRIINRSTRINKIYQENQEKSLIGYIKEMTSRKIGKEMVIVLVRPRKASIVPFY